MTSVEFVKTAAANSDLTQKEVKAACDVIENTIIAMAKDGKKFTVAGFIFEGKTSDEAVRRNPSNGESITVPAHRTIKVRVPQSVKKAVKE